MSLTFDQVPVGTKISFEVYPANIYGTTFTGVTLDAQQISPSVASELGYDIMGTHANTYSTLPSSVVNDPYQYTYFRVITEAGNKVILAVEFVKEGTLKILDSKTVVMEFTGITNDQLERAKLALSANDVSPTSIRFKDK